MPWIIPIPAITRDTALNMDMETTEHTPGIAGTTEQIHGIAGITDRTQGTTGTTEHTPDTTEITGRIPDTIGIIGLTPDTEHIPDTRRIHGIAAICGLNPIFREHRVL
ncbi:hypothetical protein [Microbulbifer sp. TRSA001]|uniref:hypothetical protein n=1 Tax=Microbulbifer sp. TRSA001 TaxID=3243381 RepID=UPI004039E0B5